MTGLLAGPPGSIHFVHLRKSASWKRWRCGDTHVWPKAGFEPGPLASQVVHHWGTIIITVQFKIVTAPGLLLGLGLPSESISSDSRPVPPGFVPLTRSSFRLRLGGSRTRKTGASLAGSRSRGDPNLPAAREAEPVGEPEPWHQRRGGVPLCGRPGWGRGPRGLGLGQLKRRNSKNGQPSCRSSFQVSKVPNYRAASISVRPETAQRGTASVTRNRRRAARGVAGA